MNNYRQLIQLDGTVTNENLATLDVNSDEIAVANIASNVYWPALAVWGVNGPSTGFKDRLTADERMADGYVGVADRFFTTVDSKPGYSIQNFSMVLQEPNFDCSGSFTVGLLVGRECAIGSITAGGGVWFLGSNTGRLRFEVGTGSSGKSGDYSDYAGPELTDTAMTAVVFIVDRENNTVTLRVDGSYELSVALDDSVTLSSELQIGALNGGTPQVRTGHYRAPVAFNAALAGVELAALESFLLSEKGV